MRIREIFTNPLKPVNESENRIEEIVDVPLQPIIGSLQSSTQSTQCERKRTVHLGSDEEEDEYGYISKKRAPKQTDDERGPFQVKKLRIPELSSSEMAIPVFSSFIPVAPQSLTELTELVEGRIEFELGKGSCVGNDITGPDIARISCSQSTEQQVAGTHNELNSDSLYVDGDVDRNETPSYALDKSTRFLRFPADSVILYVFAQWIKEALLIDKRVPKPSEAETIRRCIERYVQDSVDCVQQVVVSLRLWVEKAIAINRDLGAIDIYLEENWRTFVVDIRNDAIAMIERTYQIRVKRDGW
ncbi:hypothetical protein BJ742DRAFT_291851 [Cladochytrium replicatum]|nr:hypothetical protein BJ742DRAFT_291851 [Cladochytrium replicatum]